MKDCQADGTTQLLSLWKTVAESNLLPGLPRVTICLWHLLEKATHTHTRQTWHYPNTRFFHVPCPKKLHSFTLHLVQWGKMKEISLRYGHILFAEGCEILPRRWDHAVTYSNKLSSFRLKIQPPSVCCHIQQREVEKGTNKLNLQQSPPSNTPGSNWHRLVPRPCELLGKNNKGQRSSTLSYISWAYYQSIAIKDQ